MIRGSLDEFSLRDIIRMIAQAAKTGSLEVSGPEGSGHIHFIEGAVCGARPNRGGEPLGRRLVRAGILSDENLWEGLQRQGGTAMRIGETLVAMRLVTPDQVTDALREQLEDGIVDVLRGGPTAFSWVTGQPPDAHIRLPAEELLTSVSKRLENLEALRARFRPGGAVALSPSLRPGSNEAAIDRDEWRVLSMLGSSRPVDDILRYSASGELRTLETLDRLAAAGLIETSEGNVDVAPKGPPQPPRPPIRREPPPPPADSVRIEAPGAQGVIRLPEESPADDAFLKVAVVTTGSPDLGALAAAILEDLAKPLPLKATSYELEDRGPSPVTPESSAFDLGLDVARHYGGPLAPGALTGADLVLGFDWWHVDRAVLQAGAAAERSFTFLELLALLEEAGYGQPVPAVEAARQAVRYAHRARLARVGAPGYFASGLELKLELPESFGQSALTLQRVCARLGLVLFGAAVARGGSAPQEKIRNNFS